ncbi:MAG TPA: CD1375 family protein [Metalysinibacillus sp.]
MVAVYVALISHGVRTLDSVPEPQFEGVKEQLAILGLDGSGKPIQK